MLIYSSEWWSNSSLSHERDDIFHHIVNEDVYKIQVFEQEPASNIETHYVKQVIVSHQINETT